VEATYPRKPFSRYTPCSTFNIFNSDESNVLFASIILVFATSNGVVTAAETPPKITVYTHVDAKKQIETIISVYAKL